MAPERAGRMISLLGDAELDEGNIYECVIEGAKHDLRNCWWIVDYNRQSLDATTSERMFLRVRRDLQRRRLGRGHPEIRPQAGGGLRPAGRRGAEAAGSTTARTISTPP